MMEFLIILAVFVVYCFGVPFAGLVLNGIVDWLAGREKDDSDPVDYCVNYVLGVGGSRRSVFVPSGPYRAIAIFVECTTTPTGVKKRTVELTIQYQADNGSGSGTVL